MLNANGPGFAGLYAGDVVEFTVPIVRTRRGMQHFLYAIERAAVQPLLVFADHVVIVRKGAKGGYTVNASNFVRLVRRGKRHIAADRQDAGSLVCHTCGQRKPDTCLGVRLTGGAAQFWTGDSDAT